MTEHDLERLKKKLLKQRQEIFQELRDLDEEWQQMGERDIEFAEEAQKTELTELFGKLDERGQQEIRAIDLALTKMTTAIYGICEDCEKPIPLARLEVLPATRYCLKCSNREEEKAKLPPALAQV